MNHKTTADERFLKKLYELTEGKTYVDVNYLKVGKLVGMKETATTTIVKALAQSNFIKKMSDTHIRITERGCAFVQENS